MFMEFQGSSQLDAERQASRTAVRVMLFFQFGILGDQHLPLFFLLPFLVAALNCRVDTLTDVRLDLNQSENSIYNMISV